MNPFIESPHIFNKKVLFFIVIHIFTLVTLQGGNIMKEYNVHEVLAILQKYYITDSVQMVTRWIRDGKLYGIRGENRKEGYKVAEDDLYEFIEEQRPGLASIFEVYEGYIKALRPDQNTEELPKELVTPDSKITHSSELDEITHNPLTEEISNLKEKINNLEDYNQKTESKINKIFQENNGLMENYRKLTEEKDQLIQLNKLLTEETRRLESERKKAIKPNETFNTSSKKEEKPQYYSFDEFCKIGNEIFTKEEFAEERENKSIYLKEIYESMYSSSGRIKKELLLDDGRIKCPYTQKEYKYEKSLVTNAITYYLNNQNEEDITTEGHEERMVNI